MKRLFFIIKIFLEKDTKGSDEFRRKALEERLKSPKNQEKKVLSKPVDLTDVTFKEAIQNHSAGKIFFGKLNVDENPRVAMQYGIMSIPTLLIFKNGRLVDQIIGAMPRRMLEPRITRYL